MARIIETYKYTYEGKNILFDVFCVQPNVLVQTLESGFQENAFLSGDNLGWLG